MMCVKNITHRVHWHVDIWMTGHVKKKLDTSIFISFKHYSWYLYAHLQVPKCLNVIPYITFALHVKTFPISIVLNSSWPKCCIVVFCIVVFLCFYLKFYTGNFHRKVHICEKQFFAACNMKAIYNTEFYLLSSGLLIIGLISWMTNTQQRFKM